MEVVVVREGREMVQMDEEEHKLIVIREGEMEVVENPDADDLAEEVQMQELLFFLLQPQEHEHEVLESPQGIYRFIAHSIQSIFILRVCVDNQNPNSIFYPN